MYLIYSMPECSSCLKAKNILTIKGVKYREVELADHDERMKLLTKLGNGWRTFPVIFAQDSQGKPTRFVGGYEGLLKDLSEWNG